MLGKHESGYVRVEKDFYPTPPFVVEALTEHMPVTGLNVWEPACGDGRMSEALYTAGAREVWSTDIVDRGYERFNGSFDFTASNPTPSNISVDVIVTNPPFGPRGLLAEQFIERGLNRIGVGGTLALLLPVDFDSAKGRARFFGWCPEFAGKIVLLKRIKWFDHPGKEKVSPKENHAWFLWRRSAFGTRQVAPIMYAPSVTAGGIPVADKESVYA